MTKHIILSGIQPTGRLHIGNYLGSLVNFVELQKNHHCYFMIADYHSITENYDPKTKPQQVRELAVDFLAAGLDPKRCTIFVQSQVPAHLELAWIFNTLTPISYLERMTQYKDKAERQKSNINAGLFDYPVLQAADILLYRATAVPVGQDQDQHLELTREIVRLFNNKFGKTFTEPATLHTDTPKVMSLLTPDKKMSKSLGENHCIYIDDTPEVIAKKLSKAVTDSGDGVGQGAKNLLDLLDRFAADDVTKHFKRAATDGSLRYAELKTELATAISTRFETFRKRKNELLTKPKLVDRVLSTGAKRANRIASETLKEVRKKIGLR